MLLQNITRLAEHPIRQLGYNNADGVCTWGHKSEVNSNKYFGSAGMSKPLGIPKGYSPPYSWGLPIKGGGLCGVVLCQSDINRSVLALARYVSTLISCIGQFNPSPNLQLIVSLLADIQSSGVITEANLAGVIALIATAYGTGEITQAQLGAIIDLIVDIMGSGSINANLLGTMVLQGHIYVNEGSATVTQMAEGVWNAIASNYNTSGTMGNKLNSAGSAGDPWASDPDTFSPGTAGDKLNKISKNVINNQALILGG